MTTSTIYLGTGGYSDTDLLGTLYPKTTKKSDFLSEYAKHYGTVEINSTFYAPLGKKAFAGMARKAENRLKFAVKLHQNYSHACTATAEQATAFMEALTPFTQTNCLAALLLQFPHGFDRTTKHRHYLAQLTEWFADYPLAIEFRHASWHRPRVVDAFRDRGLIWCSVDYPKVTGLPPARLIFTQTVQTPDASPRIGYLRLHGNNLNWWDANSASERHDYRYTEIEMQGWAATIANQRNHFDELYVFFQNTTKSHAVYNIAMLKKALLAYGFVVK